MILSRTNVTLSVQVNPPRHRCRRKVQEEDGNSIAAVGGVVCKPPRVFYLRCNNHCLDIRKFPFYGNIAVESLCRGGRALTLEISPSWRCSCCCSLPEEAQCTAAVPSALAVAIMLPAAL